ncbi:TspO/MBR family protein [Pelodictyon luteolum]|uniref:CrtK protein n=1 Tax=Chlorobium luteolum (strain DSM 273 / BCRC 81028 / 2530) TaxID=319225 RepID=Q3B2D9_CHLL3|nr:TspO/MBR family protein [Pelodictyon luteolum]ABB24492.1 CrtK protein [Pelodictyon luteolum DSM 273]
MKQLNPAKTAFSIILCFLFAYGGSLFTPVPGSEWYYQTLQRPSWNPPDWLFPPVWSLLFLMMAVAFALVLSARTTSGRLPWGAISVFVAQLILNLAWSASFFGLHSPRLAFFVIILLWLMIVSTMVQFRGIVPLSSRLLVPYLLWVSFAAYLNFTIWQLN